YPWFISGWIGVIDYPESATAFARKEFRRYTHSILIDPTMDYCLIHSIKPITEELLQKYSEACTENTETPDLKSRTWQQAWTRADYQTAFDKVKNYLKAGDCYQINLTMPFTCTDDLRNCSPANLMSTFKPRHGCVIRSSERTIFSVSPERLLKITNGKLETRPIKGTAPRDSDPTQDKVNADNLTQSDKNRAENLMIVDLLRNDLSIYAEPNSVRVEKLFELESHANVHHLVSTITARLRPGISNVSALSAAFPGGSITGAPKKRAMEIIDELEVQPRGAYCGSAGYIDDNGNCDFNILIRTIEAKKDGATCWGGGGIVIDSEVDPEFDEIHSKVDKILST
ncbi:MAG: anthranilate synthase component I family protein, partial [Thalassolituus sp.]